MYKLCITMTNSSQGMGSMILQPLLTKTREELHAGTGLAIPKAKCPHTTTTSLPTSTSW